MEQKEIQIKIDISSLQKSLFSGPKGINILSLAPGRPPPTFRKPTIKKPTDASNDETSKTTEKSSNVTIRVNDETTSNDEATSEKPDEGKILQSVCKLRVKKPNARSPSRGFVRKSVCLLIDTEENAFLLETSGTAKLVESREQNQEEIGNTDVSDKDLEGLSKVGPLQVVPQVEIPKIIVNTNLASRASKMKNNSHVDDTSKSIPSIAKIAQEKKIDTVNSSHKAVSEIGPDNQIKQIKKQENKVQMSMADVIRGRIPSENKSDKKIDDKESALPPTGSTVKTEDKPKLDAVIKKEEIKVRATPRRVSFRNPESDIKVKTTETVKDDKLLAGTDTTSRKKDFGGDLYASRTPLKSRIQEPANTPSYSSTRVSDSPTARHKKSSSYTPSSSYTGSSYSSSLSPRSSSTSAYNSSISPRSSSTSAYDNSKPTRSTGTSAYSSTSNSAYSRTTQPRSSGTSSYNSSPSPTSNSSSSAHSTFSSRLKDRISRPKESYSSKPSDEYKGSLSGRVFGRIRGRTEPDEVRSRNTFSSRLTSWTRK